MIDTMTLLLLLYIALLLSFTFIAFYAYSLYKEKKEVEETENNIYKIYKKIIKNAHATARQILQSTTAKASQILSETNYVNEQLVKDFDLNLHSVAQTDIDTFKQNSGQFSAEYQQLLQQMKDEYIKEMRQMVGLLTQSISSELKDYKDIVRAETIESQTIIEKRIEDEFEKAQKEIQEYKKQELDKVNQSVQELINSITEKVLGKTIPLADHEQLIMEALEEAHAEGVFSSVSNS